MATLRGVRAWATLFALCSALACGRASGEPYPAEIAGGAGPPEPPSRWLESRRQLHRPLIPRSRPYDALVVPFQVQGYGVDPIERSLMTRALADRLWQAGQRVVDPEFVEPALGEGQRLQALASGEDSPRALADALAARRLVVGYAGHRGDGRLRITVETYERDAAGRLPERPTRVFDRADLPLSHERPPAKVLQGEVDAVAQSVLGEPPRHRRRPIGAPFETGEPPPIPAEFAVLVADSTARPVAATHLLQLLACLHPPGRARERLYERSLIALAHAETEPRHRALLEARAWHHLQRRPAARALLSATAQGPAEQALLGILDGDLERAAALDAIGPPLLQLLARIELFELQAAYARPASERVETLERIHADTPRGWRPFLGRRLIQPFDRVELTRADLELFAERFAPPGSPLEQSLALVRSWDDEAEIFMAPRSLADRLFAQQDAYLFQGATLWMPHLLDLVRLIAAAGDAAVVADVARQLYGEGSPEAALARIERYAPLYADHPELEALRAAALAELAAQEPAAAEELRRESARAAGRALVWSGGRIAPEGAEAHPLYGLFFAEFPLRLGWKLPEALPRLVGGGRGPRLDWIREAGLRVDYSVSDPSWLVALHDRLKAQGELGALTQLVTENSRRFVGHPERPAFLSQSGAAL